MSQVIFTRISQITWFPRYTVRLLFICITSLNKLQNVTSPKHVNGRMWQVVGDLVRSTVAEMDALCVEQWSRSKETYRILQLIRLSHYASSIQSIFIYQVLRSILLLNIIIILRILRVLVVIIITEGWGGGGKRRI